MIISASRRTDIPSYFSQWFLKRLQAGYVLTRNPMNPSQVSRVSLLPEDVDCIVFWTKDAANLMDKLPQMDALGYPYYFQYTITPYGTDVEQNLRPKEQILDNFKSLSSLLGKERMLWRYDPIIVNETYTIAYHQEAFEKMCESLSGYANRVTISFVDLYRKIRWQGLQEVSWETRQILGEAMSILAQKYSIPIKSCCEDSDLLNYGIEPGSCIDSSVIQRISGFPLHLNTDQGQRKNCNCVKSIDIGAYNTCLNGCLYCYANVSEKTTKANVKNHVTSGEFLLGERKETDKIYDKKRK